MKLLHRGFTLLELLIVIAIIGILVTVGAASYSSAQSKARDSRRMQDMKAIQSAMEQYYAVNDNEYLDDGTCEPDEEYLPNGIPTDPQGNTSYITASSVCNSTTDYCVCADLENDNAGNDSAGDCNNPGTGFYCVSALQ